MDIMISGGGGVLGSHIAERLYSIGHKVAIFGTSFIKGLDDGIVKHVADVTDRHSLSKLPRACDVVIHTAAVSRVGICESNPQLCLTTNIIGTLNVAEWCLSLQKPPHLVFLSSREVYGNPLWTPVTEDHPFSPISIYGLSKASAEMLIKIYRDLRFTVLRLTNIYGSVRDYVDRAIPSFIVRALRGEPLMIYGGDQIIDFCHISDFINVITLLLDRVESDPTPITCEAFNVCSGEGNRLVDVAKLILELAGNTSTIQITDPRPYETKKFIGDYTKLKATVGFMPHVKLRTGLEEYIKLIRNSIVDGVGLG
ncbi:MAG: NAD(P)-dependent oxidoreductase [Candidatus Caldarchaeum sp.]